MNFVPKKVFFLLVGLIAIAIGSFFAIGIYRAMRGAAMKACILSLGTPVTDSIRNHDSVFKRAIDKERESLTQQDVAVLLTTLLKSGATDCGTFDSVEKGVDYWGNPIRIVIRQFSDSGKLEAEISSAGPDGKENTDDDIRIKSSN